ETTKPKLARSGGSLQTSNCDAQQSAKHNPDSHSSGPPTQTPFDSGRGDGLWQMGTSLPRVHRYRRRRAQSRTLRKEKLASADRWDRGTCSVPDSDASLSLRYDPC